MLHTKQLVSGQNFCVRMHQVPNLTSSKVVKYQGMTVYIIIIRSQTLIFVSGDTEITLFWKILRNIL